MDYKEYVSPELYVLIPVMYIIGVILKKSKIKDKRIPVILGLISTALCCVWTFGNASVFSFSEVMKYLFTSVTQGILIAGAGVYVNQLYVQSKKED